jgi:hypothetical protein
MNTLTLNETADLLERFKVLAREAIDRAEELEERLGGYDSPELRLRLDQLIAFENSLRRSRTVSRRAEA